MLIIDHLILILLQQSDGLILLIDGPGELLNFLRQPDNLVLGTVQIPHSKIEVSIDGPLL